MVPAPRLDGRRVAVTRGKGGEDALSTRLRELGAEVLDVPSVVTAPPASWEALDAALRRLGGFDWIVFASATAVDATAERLSTLGLPPPGPATRLAAVGAATAARLAARLRPPDLVPPDATGAALASALESRVSGRRVLVPRAAEGRPELLDGLAAAGAQVVAAEAYRTVAAPPSAVAPLGERLAAGEVDAVAFASPSAVRSVVAGLGSRAGLLGRVPLAAIGPTTAAALEEAGLRCSIRPDAASAPGLADAIARALGPGRRTTRDG
jgi:uroporphyrinogen-III synthase